MLSQFEQEFSIWKREISKASDSVYGVLISHLYTEFLLDRYIKGKLSQEKGLTGKSGLSYSNKIKLVKSFGEINPQLADSLIKLNEIRNNCAHVFGHEISAKEVEKYGKTLGKDYKKIISEYPDSGTFGIAPISWFVAGKLLKLVSVAENWK